MTKIHKERTLPAMPSSTEDELQHIYFQLFVLAEQRQENARKMRELKKKAIALGYKKPNKN